MKYVHSERRKSTMRRVVLLTAMVAGLAWPQGEGVSFGVADLQLGMKKAEAKAEVCAHYPDACRPEVTPLVWDGEYAMVFDLVSKRSIGDLRFSDGKLVGISKSWTPTEHSATALAKALFSLVLDANQKGQAFATITARTFRTPEMTGDFVLISFGSRSISIRTDEGEIGGEKMRGVTLRDEYTLIAPPAPRRSENVKR